MWRRGKCALYLPVLTQILCKAKSPCKCWYKPSSGIVCCALFSALHILTHLILRATREVGTDEEMEAQRGWVAEPRSYSQTAGEPRFRVRQFYRRVQVLSSRFCTLYPWLMLCLCSPGNYVRPWSQVQKRCKIKFRALLSLGLSGFRMKGETVPASPAGRREWLMSFLLPLGSISSLSTSAFSDGRRWFEGKRNGV